uniref:Ig-like domain-containing protein n=1 Tax=Thelazia callipaeda TaxID=103827 RepID=A0A0N5D8P8_THECL
LSEESVIPDLPPHVDSRLEYDFIEDPHKRRYVQSLFIDSFYEPSCDHRSDVMIKPIYFWPGQRVDLRCVMCRRAFTFNGLMKHWWFMAATDVEDALENIENLGNSPKWNQHISVLSADYGENRWRDFGAMPSSSYEAGTHPRAQTVLIQRGGKLTLLQPTSENEGLYRCLDIASKNVLHFVYYLISMQPIFIYLMYANFMKVQICICFAESECPLSRGFPDSNWKFRHIPPTFIRDRFRSCKRNLSTCLDWVVSDNNMNEKKSWNLHGHSRDAELAQKYVNLKIQLVWNEWSPCEQGTSVRTREGHCYLRKINPKKNVGQMIKGVFDKYDIFNWVEKLKNHMAKIPEFNTTGIRLYSGLVSKLIHKGVFGEEKVYDDCYNIEDLFDKNPRVTKRWIDAIFAAFGIHKVERMLEISDRLCLFYYNRAASGPDDIPTTTFVGTHLIDTEQCIVV